VVVLLVVVAVVVGVPVVVLVDWAVVVELVGTGVVVVELQPARATAMTTAAIFLIMAKTFVRKNALERIYERLAWKSGKVRLGGVPNETQCAQ
jgi:hypothetical protein